MYRYLVQHQVLLKHNMMFFIRTYIITYSIMMATDYQKTVMNCIAVKAI